MRYLLFASEAFYPSGGAHDLIEVSDDPAKLIARGRRLTSDESFNAAEWWHVYDCCDRRIVAGSREQGYGVENLVLAKIVT